MATKAEKAEAIESLKSALKDCGREGSATVEITWVGGNPSSTGRSDYYEIRIIRITREKRAAAFGRPIRAEWLNFNFCRASGYRFHKSREAVMVSGCGYSKTHAIASALACIAGHEIYVDASGVDQWVKP